MRGCAAVCPRAAPRPHRRGPVWALCWSAGGPAVHGALAALLLVAAAVGAAASDGCGAVLIAAGAAVGAHSLAVVAARPYLGLWHNATEAVFGLTAAACLVAWGVASLADEEGSGGAAGASECPSGVSPLPYVLSGLANCRYPFIIARCLGVGVPTVARVVPGRRWWSVRSGRFGAKKSVRNGSGDGEPLSAGGGIALSALDGYGDEDADATAAIEMPVPTNSNSNGDAARRQEDTGRGVSSSAVNRVGSIVSISDSDAGGDDPLAGAGPPSSTNSAVSLPPLPRIGDNDDGIDYGDDDDLALGSDGDGDGLGDSADLLYSAASSDGSHHYSALGAAFDEEDF